MRTTIRAAADTALRPLLGRPACADRPVTVISRLAAPRHPVMVTRSVGSATTQCEYRRRAGARTNARIPIPVSSSSTRHAREIGASPTAPQCFSAAIAITTAASPPFISQAPRPYSRPPCTTASKGSVVQPPPAGTTSECPTNSKPGRSEPPILTITLGRFGAISSISMSKPSDLHLLTRTFATDCSVSPGFSPPASISADASETMSSASMLASRSCSSELESGRVIEWGRWRASKSPCPPPPQAS